MGLFKPWESPFPQTNTATATVTRQIDSLERRVSKLERLVESLSMPAMADGATWYNRDEFAAPAAPAWGPPWVSKATRFTERLTSAEFVRATAESAALAGVCAGAGTGIVAIIAQLPWYSAPVVGAAMFALVGGGLLIHNRTLLQQIVSQQSKPKRRTEMRVQIDRPDHDGKLRAVEFLYLNAKIEPDQLSEFARAVLDGAPLTLHNWVGEGALFSRGQYDSLMAELERHGYARRGVGNKPRTLTSKGKALMRGLAG